jgi:hypothetical protein
MFKVRTTKNPPELWRMELALFKVLSRNAVSTQIHPHSAKDKTKMGDAY